MFSERSVHLITSCTKGKNHQGHVWPTLDIDPKQTPDDAAYAWSNIVDDARSNQAVPALSLYSGNHWSTAKEILNSTRNLELWIISAGMGFLNSRDRVPSYEATFHQVPFRHDLWWKAITKSLGKHNRCATISQLMQSSPNDEYLIAASPVYIGGLGSSGTANAVKRSIYIAINLFINKLCLFIESSQFTLTDGFRHCK